MLSNKKNVKWDKLCNGILTKDKFAKTKVIILLFDNKVNIDFTKFSAKLNV